MDETNQQPPVLETTNAPNTSLGSRLTNVFVSPSEVFTEIKNSPPRPTNWVVPLIGSIVVGIIFSLVIFSQPRVIQMMKDAQEQKFQKMAAEGKIKEKQVEQMTAALDKFMSPTVLKISGSVGAAIGGVIGLFLIALTFWLVGKHALGGSFTYMQATEAVGISMMITILGGIVALLLAVIYGNVYMTPGPVLLVKNFDMTNKVHMALAKLNLMSIWWIGVLSIGLARLSGNSTAKAAVWSYAIWALLTFVPLLIFVGR